MRVEDVKENCIISLVHIKNTQGKKAALDYLNMMIDKLPLTDSEFRFCMEIVKMETEETLLN